MLESRRKRDDGLSLYSENGVVTELIMDTPFRGHRTGNGRTIRRHRVGNGNTGSHRAGKGYTQEVTELVGHAIRRSQGW